MTLHRDHKDNERLRQERQHPATTQQSTINDQSPQLREWLASDCSTSVALALLDNVYVNYEYNTINNYTITKSIIFTFIFIDNIIPKILRSKDITLPMHAT